MNRVMKFMRNRKRDQRREILCVKQYEQSDRKDMVFRRNESVRRTDLIAWRQDVPGVKWKVSRSYISDHYQEIL